MDRNIPWEPYPGLGVLEQISKVVEDFVRSADQNAMPVEIPVEWTPLMDIPRLRPN